MKRNELTVGRASGGGVDSHDLHSMRGVRHVAIVVFCGGRHGDLDILLVLMCLVVLTDASDHCGVHRHRDGHHACNNNNWSIYKA